MHIDVSISTLIFDTSYQVRSYFCDFLAVSHIVDAASILAGKMLLLQELRQRSRPGFHAQEMRDAGGRLI
jgi:hypothetical protein